MRVIVDDWTAERTIIASNVLKYIVPTDTEVGANRCQLSVPETRQTMISSFHYHCFYIIIS